MCTQRSRWGLEASSVTRRISQRRASRGETPKRATGAQIPSATARRPLRAIATTRLWRAEPQSSHAFAPLRLGARKTTPTPPPPARRDDRRNTRTGRAKAQRRQELGISAGVEDFQTVGIGAGRPAPPPRHGDRRRHARPLCGSAPLREKNNVATINTRSKSRSPITRLLRPSESRQTPPTPTESSVCRPLCPLCHCGSFVRLQRLSLIHISEPTRPY